MALFGGHCSCPVPLQLPDSSSKGDRFLNLNCFGVPTDEVGVVVDLLREGTEVGCERFDYIICIKPALSNGAIPRSGAVPGAKILIFQQG